MSIPLLIAVSIAYLVVALGYARSGRWGMAIAFMSYALANIGFMLDIWEA